MKELDNAGQKQWMPTVPPGFVDGYSVLHSHVFNVFLCSSSGKCRLGVTMKNRLNNESSKSYCHSTVYFRQTVCQVGLSKITSVKSELINLQTHSLQSAFTHSQLLAYQADFNITKPAAPSTTNLFLLSSQMATSSAVHLIISLRQAHLPKKAHVFFKSPLEGKNDTLVACSIWPSDSFLTRDIQIIYYLKSEAVFICQKRNPG